ncbi:MAG: hypothetical protein ABIQ07_09365 [Ginsengibacter sp.]
MITTKSGGPVELCFSPGSEHDVEALQKWVFQFDLVFSNSVIEHVTIQKMRFGMLKINF